MTISLKAFNKILSDDVIFEKNPHIALGVSGGPDSIALAFLLNKWIKKNKGKLTCLIVDHKIRIDSYEESFLTKKILNKLSINSKILRVSEKNIGQGKMSQARINRFEKLINYCRKNSLLHLFLAHHYDDNIETFLLRKVAGSNIEGLNCMQTVTCTDYVQIVRPFLKFKKKEILSFNKKNNLKFIEDPSNSNIKYSRVAVRNFLSLNKEISNDIKQDFELVRNNYSNYKAMIYQIFNLILISAHKDKVLVDSKKLLYLENELITKIFDLLFRFINNNNVGFRYAKIHKIVKILKNQRNVTLRTHNLYVNKDNDKLTIFQN